MLQLIYYSGQMPLAAQRRSSKIRDNIAQIAGIVKMKRDVDLQRLILLFIEQHTPPQGGLEKPVEISGYDKPTINAHLELLIESRLVDGRVI
jgi:hypothetical protein